MTNAAESQALSYDLKWKFKRWTVQQLTYLILSIVNLNLISKLMMPSQ